MNDACPLRVGVIGCGMISEVYLRNCQSSPMLEVAACADLDPARRFVLPGSSPSTFSM